MGHWFTGWSNRRTLLIIGVCGLAGILVDIDHPLHLAGIVPAFRSFHPYALLAGGIIGGFVVACVGGLLLKLVLKRHPK